MYVCMYMLKNAPLSATLKATASALVALVIFHLPSPTVSNIVWYQSKLIIRIVMLASQHRKYAENSLIICSWLASSETIAAV